MRKFFERWRLVAAWLTRQLLLAFAISSAFGAAQVYELKGPTWLVGLFGAGALFLLWASIGPRRK